MANEYTFPTPYKNYMNKKVQSGDYQLNPDTYNIQQQYADLKSQADAAQADNPKEPLVNAADMAPAVQGFQRGQSGGLGAGIMGGAAGSMMSKGLTSGNMWGAGAGLGIMALEGDAQAKQAQANAQMQEAQQRKQDQMSAINNLISVSRGLGV